MQFKGFAWTSGHYRVFAIEREKTGCALLGSISAPNHVEVEKVMQVPAEMTPQVRPDRRNDRTNAARTKFLLLTQNGFLLALRTTAA